MCLIITIIAAVICTGIWYFCANARKYNFGMLILMYWGAALMWSVDRVFCVLEGENFFDFSRNDTLLGILIMLCGLFVWGISVLIKSLKILCKIRKS